MISIIIPVYNNEIYISRCLDSIVNQTCLDYEAIVVDDGSTDDTNNICKKYSLNNSRIKVYSKENGGVSSARNLGLEKSNGEYTILEGSMYPILYKLEDAGYISSYVVKAGQRRTRKFYHIEPSGIQHYKDMLYDYMAITDSIFKILNKEDIFKWEKN